MTFDMVNMSSYHMIFCSTVRQGLVISALPTEAVEQKYDWEGGLA